MKTWMLFLMIAAVGFGYTPPADTAIIDGRILLTSSRPLETYPWRGGTPRRSEHPQEGVSDAREIAAIWEIRDGGLYLIAAAAYEFGPVAPLRSLGLHALMPERVVDGRVLADWYTGEFTVLEFERGEPSLELVPPKVPAAPKPVIRRFEVIAGKVRSPTPDESS